ncbi:hypothetical protein LS73_006615 [Helicobacter muridarum]|uniref:Uncharacterized protein n=1 Tax=Helicobacter muridarum TaxID=216 RepID=A0A099U0R4_9HELI|nr:hypothetical protein [Helicobacter muridarum]TLD99852.1 hypothetical protein LS73_006615 [Helicobacter muridarum]STQ86939.1 Uncharacterised protein [Helicobacter muridarum]
MVYLYFTIYKTITKYNFINKCIISTLILILANKIHAIEQKGYKSNFGNLQYKYIETKEDIDESTIMQKQRNLYQQNKLEKVNKKQINKDDMIFKSCTCQLMQECRAKTCIYYCDCNDKNMPFIKYVFEDSNLETAYIQRLEISDYKDMLEPILPKENTKITHENDITVEYKWKDDKAIQIKLYEKEEIVGELLFEKYNEQVIIYDNMAWLKQ